MLRDLLKKCKKIFIFFVYVKNNNNNLNVTVQLRCVASWQKYHSITQNI